MLKWFRQGPSPHQTALAMIGPKAGDRVFVTGRPEAALVAELAHVTGLNGQTTAACLADMRAAVETAAAAAGSLVDIIDLAPNARSPVPHGVTEMDIAVLVVDLSSMKLDAQLEAAREGAATLRPGGRLILIDRPRPARFFGKRGPDAMPPDVVVPMLISVGGIAARALGVADGTTFYEARKAR